MSNDTRMYNGYVDDDHLYIDEQPAAAGGKVVFFPTCRFCGKQTLPDADYDSQETANEAQRCIVIATRRGSIKTKWKRPSGARKISPAFANVLTTL